MLKHEKFGVLSHFEHSLMPKGLCWCPGKWCATIHNLMSLTSWTYGILWLSRLPGRRGSSVFEIIISSLTCLLGIVMNKRNRVESLNESGGRKGTIIIHVGDSHCGALTLDLVCIPDRDQGATVDSRSRSVESVHYIWDRTELTFGAEKSGHLKVECWSLNWKQTIN